MTGTKEADLVTAVFLYAMRCLAEGDQPALSGMNFGPKEVEALKQLGLNDLYRAGTLHCHCLTIQLNHKVYWPFIEHLSRVRQLEDLQQTLIGADAPLDMMRALFGVGSREYTRLRRLFSMSPSVGRPPEPDEASSHALWEAWSKRVADAESGHLKAQDYLSLHQETELPVRAIWNLTRRWSEFGNLNT